jgi:hypothetical protein
MKKLAGILFTGLCAVLSADLPVNDVAREIASTAVNGAVSDATPSIQAPARPSVEDVSMARSGFFYVQFAVAENDLAHMQSVLPGFGLGYRRLAGNGAADISITGIGRREKRGSRLFWTSPKASYIHYLQPDHKQSFYLGGGLAWGGLKSKSESFVGIIPSLRGGYEFSRKSAFLGFTELNVNQPAIAVYRSGPFPTPIVEWTVGVGF